MEKTELMGDILCTLTDIQVSKFIFARILRLIFGGIWPKPVTVMRNRLQTGRRIDQDHMAGAATPVPQALVQDALKRA